MGKSGGRGLQVQPLTFDVAAFDHPFHRAKVAREFPEGFTILDVIREADIPADLVMSLQVTITRGDKSSVVPMAEWARVRPRAGVFVDIFPRVQGPAIGAVISAVFAAAAPAIVGAIFPSLVAGTIGYAIAVAAVTVIGALISRALIPPPTQVAKEDPRYFLTGTSNQAQPYSPYPTVLGRHRMFPVKTAAGYTETVGQDVYLRERMTLGYGPVALESLKIGNTDITDFDGVEIEFLNVDKDLTLANIPDIETLLHTKNDELYEPRKSMPNGADHTVQPGAPAARADFYVNISGLGSGEGAAIISSAAVKVWARPVGSPGWFLNNTVGLPLDNSQVVASSNTFADSQVREFLLEVQIVGAWIGNARAFLEKVVVEYQVDESTTAFRQGTETMTLYSDDIAEDSYAVLLEHSSAVVRQTRTNTRAAQIDISFQGLVTYGSSGERVTASVDVLIEYKAVADATWTTHETLACSAATGEFIRFTSEIDFPAPGEYDIRVTRTTADTTNNQIRDLANLTAIRSIQNGTLPSHENIAEIAIRIKASNELSGQLQSLNAVVQQLGHVWDGSAWSALQPIRHPAWVLARAMRGPMLRDPVADERIGLAGLKAWADEEPHWTCDTVISSSVRAGEVFGLIAAAGRARFGLDDLKFGVIRDGAAGGIVQHFTSRNSWGFSGSRYLDRKIHALRCRAVSERLEWAQDEIIVYADGYGAENATEIETLELPGVVLTLDDDNQGNVWRLGRYHLAVAILRPEDFEFYCDLDHLRCQSGDKARVVLDVPKFGVGSARIKSVTYSGSDLVSVDLDATIATGGDPARLRVRTKDGSDIAFAATPTGETWTPDGTVTDVIEVGDLAMVELVANIPVDVLIKDIEHEGDLVARLRVLPAAPDVLTADTGTIPDYDPQITVVDPYLPPVPRLGTPPARCNRETAVQDKSGALVPRAGVLLLPLGVKIGYAPRVCLKWKIAADVVWTISQPVAYASEVFTAALETGAIYDIEVALVDLDGGFSPWVSAGQITASIANNPPPEPLGWGSLPGTDTVMLYGPAYTGPDFKEYVFYAATATSATLMEVGRSRTSPFVYRPDPDDEFTRYKVAIADYEGNIGDPTAFIDLEPTGVTERLTTGLGANMISNSLFADGLTGWAHAGGSGDGNTDSSLSLKAPGELWAGLYYPVALVDQPTGNSTGYFDVESWPFYADGVQGKGYPVTPGEWIEASAKVAVKKCSFDLLIHYWDAAGASLSYSPSLASADAGAGTVGSNSNPESNPSYWGKHQVPASAAFATLVIRKNATNSGQSDSLLAFLKPQLARAHADATVMSPFRPGATTLISGGLILTESIATHHLSTTDLEITGDFIVRGAVSIPYNGHGTADITSGDLVKTAATKTGMSFLPKIVEAGVVKNPIEILIYMRAKSSVTAGPFADDSDHVRISMEIMDGTDTAITSFTYNDLGAADVAFVSLGNNQPWKNTAISFVLDETTFNAYDLEDVARVDVKVTAVDCETNQTITVNTIISIRQINR